MGVNLRATARAGKAIAAIAALAIGGFVTLFGQKVPEDTALAATYVVIPWEGTELRAYPDPASGGAPYTICNGDTEGVVKGMVETPAGCQKRTVRQLLKFRADLVACIPHYESGPLSWRASMQALAYNIGSGRGKAAGGVCNSTAAKFAAVRDYRKSCEAATVYDKARIKGKLTPMRGLTARRGMGDAARIGEGELCVSGLEVKK
jgi:GH24 family phage-related lysozyme (muramidase)